MIFVIFNCQVLKSFFVQQQISRTIRVSFFYSFLQLPLETLPRLGNGSNQRQSLSDGGGSCWNLPTPVWLGCVYPVLFSDKCRIQVLCVPSLSSAIHIVVRSHSEPTDQPSKVFGVKSEKQLGIFNLLLVSHHTNRKLSSRLKTFRSSISPLR